MTCDKAGAGDWQPVGLSGVTVTTVRPYLPQQIAGREHKGIAGTTGWFGQLFFPKFQALHVCENNRPMSRPTKSTPGLNRDSKVRSARARPPVPIFDLGGYALW